MAKKSQEAKKALEMLGHDPEKAEGGDLDEFEDDPSGSDPAVEQEESPGSDPAPVEEEQPGSDQPAEEQEEEPKSWQSSYDKARHELELERKQREALEQQNKILSALVGNGQQPQQEQQPQAKKDERPKLSDFIDVQNYDRIDALDPTTPSGQAKEQYDDALIDWRTRQAIQQDRQKTAEQKRNEIAQQQAARLAEQYAEFRDVFGNPDMKKISQFIDGLANEEDPDFWAKLYKLKKQPDSVPMDVSKIGKNANKTSKTAGQPASEETPKKTPKVFKEMNQFFGEFEYPSGAEFE